MSGGHGLKEYSLPSTFSWGGIKSVSKLPMHSPDFLRSINSNCSLLVLYLKREGSRKLEVEYLDILHGFGNHEKVLCLFTT